MPSDPATRVIRQRLLRVVMTTTLAALLLSATALLLFELQTVPAGPAQPPPPQTGLLAYASFLALVTLAGLALAWLVVQRLQRSVTDPIVAVAGAQSAELQAADRRKDAFLATLAHELRNPLAPVSTALLILARGDADAATQARLVAMMQRQMQQFVRLIDDLMEVSRISTGHLALRVERLDLVQVLRGAVEAVAPTLLERGHTLAVQWPPPVWMHGDRTRLGQVFANLLGNAAKYTEPGGHVGIGWALEPGQVQVQVSDSGVGIAPEMQRAVFEMFVQVDPSVASGRSGLGVGLSLARQLVQLHDGSLTLASAGIGHGCTFTVQLPRLDSPGPTA